MVENAYALTILQYSKPPTGPDPTILLVLRGSQRETFTPSTENVKCQPLDSGKVVMPPLHVKRALVKRFVKGLNKDGKTRCLQDTSGGWKFLRITSN